MNFDITPDGGLIRLGPYALLWENSTDEYPGFTTISNGEYSLEFGEIDQGNGIFVTKYTDEDIEYTKALIQL